MKQYKKYLWLLVIVAVVLSIALILIFWPRPKQDEKIEVSPGKVHEIEAYVRLCSVDIYSEVPVLDTINKKVIFGIQKQSGSISFDIERLSADTLSDTIRVLLPKEIIELYESTEPGSWEVVDTKNISTLGFLKGSRLTADEENSVKQRIKERSVERLRADGTIARARKEAADNLRSMLEKVYRKPVEVVDSLTVEGTYKDIESSQPN